MARNQPRYVQVTEAKAPLRVAPTGEMGGVCISVIVSIVEKVAFLNTAMDLDDHFSTE